MNGMTESSVVPTDLPKNNKLAFSYHLSSFFASSGSSDSFLYKSFDVANDQSANDAPYNAKVSDSAYDPTVISFPGLYAYICSGPVLANKAAIFVRNGIDILCTTCALGYESCYTVRITFPIPPYSTASSLYRCNPASPVFFQFTLFNEKS